MYIFYFLGECPPGYLVDDLRCVDENECVSNNGHGPCQDTCLNTEGSFQCACDVRFFFYHFENNYFFLNIEIQFLFFLRVCLELFYQLMEILVKKLICVRRTMEVVAMIAIQVMGRLVNIT